MGGGGCGSVCVRGGEGHFREASGEGCRGQHQGIGHVGVGIPGRIFMR